MTDELIRTRRLRTVRTTSVEARDGDLRTRVTLFQAARHVASGKAKTDGKWRKCKTRRLLLMMHADSGLIIEKHFFRFRELRARQMPELPVRPLNKWPPKAQLHPTQKPAQ